MPLANHPSTFYFVKTWFDLSCRYFVTIEGFTHKTVKNLVADLRDRGFTEEPNANWISTNIVKICGNIASNLSRPGPITRGGLNVVIKDKNLCPIAQQEILDIARGACSFDVGTSERYAMYILLSTITQMAILTVFMFLLALASYNKFLSRVVDRLVSAPLKYWVASAMSCLLFETVLNVTFLLSGVINLKNFWADFLIATLIGVITPLCFLSLAMCLRKYQEKMGETTPLLPESETTSRPSCIGAFMNVMRSGGTMLTTRVASFKNQFSGGATEEGTFELN